MSRVRYLVLVLGDQLDVHSAAFDGFDAAQDGVFMAEVAEESTHVPSHKVRTAYFFSAMRHFAEGLRGGGFHVVYRKLDAKDNAGSLDAEWRRAVQNLRPERLIAVEPGEYRVEQLLRDLAGELHVPLELRPDRHFYCSRQEFAAWAKGHKQLRLEFFYRDMRSKTGVLMENGEPVGEQWNFDPENRKSFGKAGPREVPVPRRFPPDAVTQEVIELVEARFSEHPGSLENFDLPVTAAEAQLALQDFITHRLPVFGLYQDAMWTSEPVLYHARLSATMNLKLMNPRSVLVAVQDAYHRGDAPLAAVEGFVRQILGWREYIHGVYWLQMPGYLQQNALQAREDLPDFYWTGDTDMNCLRHAVGQTLQYGYAHHIQRLMVTGLYAMLFGVRPPEIHKWYLAIYWDAVEWVELPNVYGLSQFADGGLIASKPYAATGKYIARMSNYCQGCRYKPDESLGERACPFTTLYWDFLMRHEERLKRNPRMELQVRNLARLSEEKKQAIREQATAHRAGIAKGSY